MIELHTGAFANAQGEAQAAELASAAGGRSARGQPRLQVNAGHGLNYQNLPFLLGAVPHLRELNIGHSIVSRAVFVGLDRAVGEMLKLMMPDAPTSQMLSGERRCPRISGGTVEGRAASQIYNRDSPLRAIVQRRRPARPGARGERSLEQIPAGGSFPIDHLARHENARQPGPSIRSSSSSAQAMPPADEMASATGRGPFNSRARFLTAAASALLGPACLVAFCRGIPAAPAPPG